MAALAVLALEAAAGSPEGSGGFGAGAGGVGAKGGAGGGGLGAGGDIFVMAGASLTIEGGSLGTGIVSGGLGSSGGGNGDAFGGGLFLQGNETITLAPASGTVETISGVIADQTGSGGKGTNAGAGGLILDGAGTVDLTAANTYTGGTTISAGTLQIGAGGTTGSLVGNVVDNAKLAFDRSNSVTFAGVVSGSGSLTQLGAGTIDLTAANTYTGGTTISAGTLQIGAGGTTGSIVGNVVDKAKLAFDRSNSVTFAGVVSGSGSLTQLGAGTVDLTAANTYTGGTTISAGTLQIGAGGTTGSLVGNVVDKAKLAFDRSNSVTFAGVVSGSGSLTQLGAGAVDLTGANTYTGGTTIAQGVLELGNATAAGSGEIGLRLDERRGRIRCWRHPLQHDRRLRRRGRDRLLGGQVCGGRPCCRQRWNSHNPNFGGRDGRHVQGGRIVSVGQFRGRRRRLGTRSPHLRANDLPQCFEREPAQWRHQCDRSCLAGRRRRRHGLFDHAESRRDPDGERRHCRDQPRRQ